MALSPHFTPTADGDTAFTVEAPKITFGRGSLGEVGDDARAMTRVALYTDPVVRDLEPLSIVRKSLGRAGIDRVVYDAVEGEPTDRSFKAGAGFAADGGFDGFVSVGGGSVMDTCKAGFSNPANGILSLSPTIIFQKNCQ